MSANAALFVFAALLCLHVASAYRPTTESVVDENGHVVGKLSLKEGFTDHVPCEKYLNSPCPILSTTKESLQICREFVCGKGHYREWEYYKKNGECKGFMAKPPYEQPPGCVRASCP